MSFVSTRLCHVAGRLTQTATCSVLARRSVSMTGIMAAKKKREDPHLQMTDSEKQKFLEILNQRTEAQLSDTRAMSTVSARRLTEYKQTHGPLQSLDDLWKIPMFPRRQLFSMFLKHEGTLPLKGRKWNAPSLLTEEQKATVQSIVSIDVGVKQCAWTHISRDLKVLDWKKEPIEYIKKTYDPTNYAYKIKEFISQLPQADVYLIELQSLRILKNTRGVYPFMIQIRITEAMILSFLSDSLVFSINPQVVKDFFKLQTGAKKKQSAVKSVEVIIKEMQDLEVGNSPKDRKARIEVLRGFAQQALTHEVVGSFEFLKQLDIPHELRTMFTQTSKRDDLSDCLLQALYFIYSEGLLEMQSQATTTQQVAADNHV